MSKDLYCADIASYQIKYLLNQIIQKAASVEEWVFCSTTPLHLLYKQHFCNKQFLFIPPVLINIQPSRQVF